VGVGVGGGVIRQKSNKSKPRGKGKRKGQATTKVPTHLTHKKEEGEKKGRVVEQGAIRAKGGGKGPEQ